MNTGPCKTARLAESAAELPGAARAVPVGFANCTQPSAYRSCATCLTLQVDVVELRTARVRKVDTSIWQGCDCCMIGCLVLTQEIRSPAVHGEGTRSGF